MKAQLLGLGLLGLSGLGAGAAHGGGEPRLQWPVRCVVGASCVVQHYVDQDPGPGIRDFACGSTTYQDHSGIDIRLRTERQQAAGVDVLSAAAGRVLRVRDGVVDMSVRERGAAAVKGEECGNGLVIDHGQGLQTQYCHMRRGSLKVKPGDQVSALQPLGQVGLSGNTEFPHLHFTVRQGGKVVDPFNGGAVGATCGGGTSMWDPGLRAGLAYKASTVLNRGFTADTPTMARVEAGDLEDVRVGADTPMIVFVRSTGLKQGDSLSLTLTGPGGETLAASAPLVLDRNKAQQFMFVGRKARAGGWPAGVYTARFRVERAGAVALSDEFRQELRR
jgi:hypothetical protein